MALPWLLPANSKQAKQNRKLYEQAMQISGGDFNKAIKLVSGFQEVSKSPTLSATAKSYGISNFNSINDYVQFQQRFSGAAPAAPTPAPTPAPAPAPAPLAPAANQYTAQVANLEKELAAARTAAMPNISAMTADTERKYQDMIKEMQISSANALKALTNQYDLTIGGLKSEYGKQIGGLQSEITGLRGQMQAEAKQYQEGLANLTAGQRAFQMNQARANVSPNLQIQPATTEATTGGTSGFKRRRKLDETMMIGGNSALNVPTTNVLNV